MDWLQKNYERVVLIAGVAILLVSAFCIFQRAIGFQSQFAELQSHPPQRPASPPGKAKEVEDALQKLRQPSQWTFGGRSGLFVPEKHLIGTDGQPATLHTTEVHPPVPNEWIEQFSLPIADADVLEQDPDGDGFTNFDEWQGHTNPIDRNSHPDYLTKLKLKSFSQEPFRLVFASRTEDTFGINTIDLTQPTQFVKIGDTIAGTHFRRRKVHGEDGQGQIWHRHRCVGVNPGEYRNARSVDFGKGKSGDFPGISRDLRLFLERTPRVCSQKRSGIFIATAGGHQIQANRCSAG